MKKFLATMLSFAMLLGAGLMQVSALGSNEGYPYLFETFETEESLNGLNKPDASRATVSRRCKRQRGQPSGAPEEQGIF